MSTKLTTEELDALAQKVNEGIATDEESKTFLESINDQMEDMDIDL